MKNSFSNADRFIAQLKSIEQQINQNQLQKAALALNQLGKTDPNDPRVFLLGSRLADAARNPEAMLQSALKAYQLAPQWPVASLHLANVLASRDDAHQAMILAVQAVQQATAQSSADLSLLSDAAALAQRLGQYPQALAWLRQAQQVAPQDIGTQYKIGLALSASGEFDSAIAIFTTLLAQRPAELSLLIARRQAALGAQQMALAAQDSEALLVLDPQNEEHLYYLAIARGETPETQPASIVALLFNELATQFDQRLVVHSQYKLPRDVAEMIKAWHPDSKSDVLDLGCGTGLLGACLGRMEGVLVGVDLSEGMLAQASRHQVYDRFHQVNVLDALQATPEGQYHIITALDVLIYVGKLDSVIPDAYRILLPGGRFVFSCEAGAEGDADYALKSSNRYTHQRRYVQRLLEEAGFKDIEMQDRILRYEADQPVHGFLITAFKPAQTAPKKAPRKAEAGAD